MRDKAALDRMRRCLAFLRPIAQPVADKAEHPRWIAARNADPDQGPDWCLACAKAEVDRLNAASPEREYLVDGGFGSDSDSSSTCDKCGKRLFATLTDHGVESELEHFSGVRLSLRGKYASHTAFDLVNLLECAFMGDVDACPWLRGYQADRARENQRGVRKLLRRIDRIRARAAGLASLAQPAARQQSEG